MQKWWRLIQRQRHSHFTRLCISLQPDNESWLFFVLLTFYFPISGYVAMADKKYWQEVSLFPTWYTKDTFLSQYNTEAVKDKSGWVAKTERKQHLQRHEQNLNQRFILMQYTCLKIFKQIKQWNNVTRELCIEISFQPTFYNQEMHYYA
jgi:hypothetical protein